MSTRHDSRSRRVAEPVQVYLAAPERTLLDRLVERLGATKSDVLRRALAALDRELRDPARDPVLRLIGIADGHAAGSDPGYDVAREHDRYLAAREEASWKPESKRRGR